MVTSWVGVDYSDSEDIKVGALGAVGGEMCCGRKCLARRRNGTVLEKGARLEGQWEVVVGYGLECVATEVERKMQDVKVP